MGRRSNEWKRRRRQRLILVIMVMAFVLLAVTYLLISFYFKNHFYLHTEVNGLKVGGMTAEGAEDKIEEDVGDYLLTIFDRDGNKYHIMGREIDSHYVPDGALGAALEDQNMFAWIPYLFKGNSIDVDTPMTYDNEKLAAAVAALECFREENIIEPENAYIVKTEEEFALVPEVMGTRMKLGQVTDKVKAAISSGEGNLTLTDEVYVNPEVVSESQSIRAVMDRLESCLENGIVYEIGSQQEGLDREEMFDLLLLDDNMQIELDEKAVERYVQYLASKYNTYADPREFTTSQGDVVSVEGGDYGWVIDKEAEAEQLKKDLLSGERVQREPLYSQTAKADGPNDIGDTYVEIDYTKQHMWFYKEGQLILESDIVSGTLSNGNGSPDGIFKIVYKDSPAILVGETYESEVQYFMPFAYNVGFHDATWRSEFGGEIYRSAGSHGCINLPGNVAEELYKNIEVGTPVVAFYRETVKLTSESADISNAASYVEPEKKPWEKETAGEAAEATE